MNHRHTLLHVKIIHVIIESIQVFIKHLTRRNTFKPIASYTPNSVKHFAKANISKIKVHKKIAFLDVYFSQSKLYNI